MQTLSEKYGDFSSISYTYRPQLSSATWRSLNEVSQFLSQRKGWHIGNGRQIRFWVDIWLLDCPLHLVSSCMVPLDIFFFVQLRPSSNIKLARTLISWDNFYRLIFYSVCPWLSLMELLMICPFGVSIPMVLLHPNRPKFCFLCYLHKKPDNGKIFGVSRFLHASVFSFGKPTMNA